MGPWSNRGWATLNPQKLGSHNYSDKNVKAAAKRELWIWLIEYGDSKGKIWASLVTQWYRFWLQCRRHGFEMAGSISGLGRSPREGNGNPVQYSCLGNPMDRGAWWATVQGIKTIRHNLATKPPPRGAKYLGSQCECCSHTWLKEGMDEQETEGGCPNKQSHFLAKFLYLYEFSNHWRKT